jgi:hypothetical protein
MKTSNRLLWVLLACTMLAILGSNLVLKAEYDRIDFKDPFYGYSRESATPFSVLKLQGGYSFLVQVQPGKDFEVRVSEKEKSFVKWQVRGDTLQLTFSLEDSPFYYRVGDAFNHRPVAYISAPQLKAVHAYGSTCKLTGWQHADWILTHQGLKSGMQLIDNAIDTLSATVQQGGFLQVDAKNRIGKTQVRVMDSSSFVARKDVFESVKIQADSTASVNLPGALFLKLTQP